MAYEQYRRWMLQYVPGIGRGPVLDLVSESISGGTSVLFTYPLDLVRTNLAYQVVGPSHSNANHLSQTEQVYNGIFYCLSKIYKTNGIRGLYRGAGPSMLGIFPYLGLKFYFYEEMRGHVPTEYEKDITVKLLCGSVAGLLGQTITYPLDVVRRQMQVQALSVTDNASTCGTIKTLMLIVNRQGWRHLFSGLSINYVKVVPLVAIEFTVYDLMKAFLEVPSREEVKTKMMAADSSRQSS